MRAEIISIGDELLIGQVVNTNASWMAERLNSIGISVKYISVIGDSREDILKSFDDAKGRVDLILITGGIGPTKDDITKTTMCEYFDTSLVINKEALNDLEIFFKKRGVELTELNRKQAELPANCIAIKNSIGTARGMWFEKEEKIFVSMPGVPFEMKSMMTDYILPLIVSSVKYQVSSKSIYHKTILTQGIGESFLSEMIEGWENILPKNIKLAYLPSPGIVRLRLSAYSEAKGQKSNVKNESQEALKIEVEKHVEDLKKIISEYIYGYDDDTLEDKIGKLLREKGMAISTAESCTGGYIAHRITSVAGSSDYFTGSVIAYSNKIKEDLLKVKHDSILKHGAVSEEVAKEMAIGVRKEFGTDCSIAITGIAGPDGGTEEKPVGTVWIAVAIKVKSQMPSIKMKK